jgi:hydroxymethylglutaryl-CoA lyase
MAVGQSLLPRDVSIVEVAPRDGLQNEAALIATEKKIALVDMISECGFERIEVTSFVSPKRVPQLADAAGVMAGIHRRPGVRYAVLTPNIQGFEAAMAAGADEIAIFASASESFSRQNINCSIAESIERFRPVADASRARGVPMRGYVSCVVECPYDGRGRTRCGRRCGRAVARARVL